MAVHDIAYVELYTRDKVSALDYLVSAMGFTRVADSVEFDRSSVLLRQGEVQLIVTSGRGIWTFLDEHGDGVADIALICDDVRTTSDAAAAAGATVTTFAKRGPVVSGVGDVCHTLLPADDSATGLPVGHNWVVAPGAPMRPTGRIQRLDHVAVCLEGAA